MRIDDFINYVRSEPEMSVTRDVFLGPANVLPTPAQPGGVSLTDFVAASRHRQRRDFLYRHVLGPPAPREAIDAWRNRWPSYEIPRDLIALLQRCNGIHLWADTDTGRAYVGIAPIEEWQPARIAMYGPDSATDLLDDRYLAISYHEDRAAFVVLNVKSGAFFLMDAAGPDESTPLGNRIEDVLDWLWNSRNVPA